MHTKSLAFRNASTVRATGGHDACEHVFVEPCVCVCARMNSFIQQHSRKNIQSSTSTIVPSAALSSQSKLLCCQASPYMQKRFQENNL